MKSGPVRQKVDPNSKLRFGLLQIGKDQLTYRVMIKNLSETGLTANRQFEAPVGTAIRILLRNNGWAKGIVSKVGPDDFEMSFERSINTLGEEAPLLTAERK